MLDKGSGTNTSWWGRSESSIFYKWSTELNEGFHVHCILSRTTLQQVSMREMRGAIYGRKVKVKSLSHVWLFATSWTVAHQVPLSMEFFRQEYWSGLPFPSPGYLSNSGIEPGSSVLQADALPSEPPWKPCHRLIDHKCKGLFLSSLLCSIVLYVCFWVNTTLSWAR